MFCLPYDGKHLFKNAIQTFDYPQLSRTPHPFDFFNFLDTHNFLNPLISLAHSTSWWKEAIIYQVYPRSFKDSNGDGIGDLNGIISKLDYLHHLGIDVIWLSPMFDSPNTDNGYDISDYRAIMADFGTMQDFEELLQEVHNRGMKLILDLVVNHTSDQHEWFRQSRQGQDNAFRDYYIWQPPQADGSPPNDWISFFSGSAWQLDSATKAYYLHLFTKQQPDLNWDNPQVRREIYDLMHFWFGKGIDGFRMDVIPFLSKDRSFTNYPEGRFGDLSLYANGPRIHEFLREMHQEVLSHYDCLSVGEAFGVSADQALLYVGQQRHELNMIYHFDHAVPREEINFVKPAPELKLSELRAIFNRWDKALSQDGWQNIYLGNHDNPRIVSRFGDTGKYHQTSAKMLATVLLTLRGTPSIYQGDELGMSNCPFEKIEDFDDVQVKNAYEVLVRNGSYATAIFLAAVNRIARDHARTPMQWSSTALAGFSDGKRAWLKVNPNYTIINAEAQVTDPDSVFHYYRQLIALRKTTPALVYGHYHDLRPRCNRIYAFTRVLSDQKYLIMCNFTAQDQTFSLSLKHQVAVMLVANYPVVETTPPNTLRPFEARVYRYE